jgi:hypothetical protein
MAYEYLTKNDLDRYDVIVKNYEKGNFRIAESASFYLKVLFNDLTDLSTGFSEVPDLENKRNDLRKRLASVFRENGMGDFVDGRI